MLSIYIHWPFCRAKCPYCDFNSHVWGEVEQEKWLQYYLRELDYFAGLAGRDKQVATIFFGGGTPSLMQPQTVALIIRHIYNLWPVIEDVEVTLEANPTSIEANKFKAFREAGINRASIGIQAFDDNALQFLGRKHSSEEALAALDIAANCFDNVSFDLIYARPGQSPKDWESELKQALELAAARPSINHLSLYQLTIEKGTPFFTAHKSGEFAIPEDSLAAEMYELTSELTSRAGMSAYEVSNYAYPGAECRHNLNYWNYGEYIGAGAGAHGRVITADGRLATMTWHNPQKWADEVMENGHGIQNREVVQDKDLLAETLLMGLRLTEGISRRNFRNITGREMEELLSADKLSIMQSEGLIIPDDNGLRTTPKGRMLLGLVTSGLLNGHPL